MPARLPLPKNDELPAEIKETLETLPPLNVFRMVANAPASFKGFLELAMSILAKSEFDPRKREIAVLRVARVTRSDYIWTQHIRVAKSVGVSDDEIKIISEQDPVNLLDKEGNLLCRAADEISRDVKLSDDALTKILDFYGIRGAAELILCISYFNMLSRFLESTRVEIEKENKGESFDNH